jgi:hypothetical protein
VDNLESGRAKREGERNSAKVSGGRVKYKIRVSSSGSYYALQDSNIIGLFTVLAANCTAASRDEAQTTNDPVARLEVEIQAAAATEAEQQAAMDARLDASVPLLAALRSEDPPSLNITGLSASKQLVWMGIPGIICYSIPPSANVNPKNLVLYIGRGGALGTYYVNCLGPANGPLPAGPTACVRFTISTGVAVGPYTIALEDAATGGAFAAVSLEADRALISVTGFIRAGATATVTVSWILPASRASANDTVLVVDATGGLGHWFYTRCGCQDNANLGSAPAPTGSLSFRIRKGQVAGGYLFELRPGGGNVVADVAKDWIPWAKFGW